MSAVVTPALAAVDTEALRTEWALKIVVSTPAFPIKVFIHLAMVDDATALCGLMVAMSSLLSLLAFLIFSVAASYARRVCTGHSFRLCGKLGKISAISLSGLDCLANFVGLNTTPSGMYLLKRRSRLVRSLDLVGLVRASSMVSFVVRSRKSRFALSPRLSR